MSDVTPAPPSLAAQPSAAEERQRSLLEIITAILLGLVSVATAAGAYQASEWAEQSGRYAVIAVQLRDESLSTNIATQLASLDDGERMFDALAIEFDIMDGADDVAELREEQALILDGGSPGLTEQWMAWVEAGYPDDRYPASSADFLAEQLGPTYAANRASATAYEISDAIGDRSLTTTVAAVVFALALLLLGASGANKSLRVAVGLAVGGAIAFVVGAAISAFAIVG